MKAIDWTERLRERRCPKCGSTPNEDTGADFLLSGRGAVCWAGWGCSRCSLSITSLNYKRAAPGAKWVLETLGEIEAGRHGGWISIHEQMPQEPPPGEPWNRKLLVTDGREQWAERMRPCNWHVDDVWADEEPRQAGITHWRPLLPMPEGSPAVLKSRRAGTPLVVDHPPVADPLKPRKE